ncbi:MAG: helix-turn-helix domain-containing protein [Microscillaceae bacterium]
MPEFVLRGKKYNNPVELSLDLIGGKYKMPILWRLQQQAWRYGALKKDLGRITHKMLTEQLREMEQDGLIAREVFPEIPPRVEYSLTPLGRKALPIIEQLRKFGYDFKENYVAYSDVAPQEERKF